MSAFREEDEKFFFGRQKFVDSLVEVVYRQPLVVVIGASGSGKSSVVFAGLIPKLREKGNWLIASFRPQNQPFFGLASALVRLLKPDLDETQQPGRAAELVADLKGKLTLPQVVASILARYPGKRLLLVIDQFEELYNPRNDTEQQPFVDALLAAIESAPSDLTVVLTLRADFLSYLLNYPTFGAALQQYKPQLLGAMNREEMREAIERPAEEMGVKLEEGLTERILDAVKREPGNLPLLEFALEQLWARQKNSRLTHDAYDDIKGVEKALAGYAQTVYEELTQKNDGKQIQQIFIQLVRVGEGTEDTRQLATRAEVGGDNWDLVKQLADKRLVVTGRNEATGEETVEVVHEALIREWGLLRQWIDENRKKLIQKREIEDAAKRWRDRGKAKDYLLGGKVLTEARVFQKQEGGNLRLSDLGKEFIGQSLKRRRKDRFSIGLYWIIIFILLSLVALGGTIVATQIKLRQLWAIVNREKIDSPARIKALQDLVKLVKANNNFGGIVRIDLSYVNIRNVDFSGVDLSSAILLNADLSGANLSGTILSRTNLINANLSGADLSDTDLTDASLSNTNLSNANLSGADLTDADLSHSKFFGSNLSGANLGGANLSSADLSGTDFSNGDLSGANLSGADLKGTNFSNTDLSDANLSHVKFQKITIVHSGDRKRLISNAEEESYLRLKQESESTDLGRGNPKPRNAIILENKNVNLDNANLDNANLKGAKNLTPEQVKSAKNWQQAIYDEEFRKKLGLK